MALIKFSIICFFLLIWIIKKKDLGLGLIIASLALGLWNIHWSETVKATFKTFYAWETIKLIIAMILIFYFTKLWQDSGKTKEVVENLNRVIKDTRVALVVPSALIGILPMIGGALISAPFLNDSPISRQLSPAKKTFLNYWFRHIWEYTIPTYPAVILTASLLNISYGKVFLLNLPLTLGMILTGIIFGLYRIKYYSSDKPLNLDKKAIINKLILPLSPLLLIIIFVLVLKVELFISVGIVVLGMIISYRTSPKQALTILKKSFDPGTISIVLGVMSFKQILQATGTIYQVSQEFINLGIPVIVLLFILPFIVGFATGVAISFVGIAFPLLLTYFTNNINYLPWAYFAGYAGVLLSPVHYCLVLTKQYFKAEWKDIYRLLALPAALLFVIVFVYLQIQNLL